MKYVMDGLRAATLVALALTLWSLMAVSGAMEAASDAAGLTYVLAAFGLLAAPQLAYGAALGAVGGIWSRALRARVPGDDDTWAARLRTPQGDRLAAASLLALPLLAGLGGAIVGGIHLLVTGAFVRLGFQAAGLALAAAVAVAAVAVAAPLVLGPLTWLLARIPGLDAEPPRALRAVLAVAALAAAAAICVAYVYASGLDVWPAQTVLMALFGVAATPALTVAMARFRVDRPLWDWGLPIAGLALAAVAFVGAAGWTSTDGVRAALAEDKGLFAAEARFLQRFADADGDGYAASYGGNDCDDTDAAIYPGARDVPGNGIDESCSGADAEPPTVAEHPALTLVSRAQDQAAAAARKAAENIPDPPRNVVVLLIDTLRYDHLGYAGYPRDTSPNIDRLAEESVVFERHYATSPHTPRSIPALFFSRYASRTNWRGGQYNYPKVRPENLGLFEVLDEAGWDNAGVSSHFYFEEKQGLRQGFDRWDNEGAGTIAESNDDIAAPRVWAKLEPTIEALAAAQKSAGSGAEPFGLFVHLFEPHARWIEHDAHRFRDEHQKDSRVNAYDSEIAYVDTYVGKIVDKLRDTGLLDDTIIVLTSDHGEAFNEHGFFFHGQTLYEEVIHIPLLVRVPGWFHRRVDTPTSLVDIAPTVLDLVGLPVPPAFDGVSLEPAMLGEAMDPTRPIFAELLPYTSWKEHHKAVIVGDSKLISVFSKGTEELYDLGEDAAEKTNLVSKDAARAKELRDHIQHFQNQPE